MQKTVNQPQTPCEPGSTGGPGIALIELVTVSAIGAILLGMLLPGLESVQARAERAVYSGDVHHIEVALTLGHGREAADVPME